MGDEFVAMGERVETLLLPLALPPVVAVVSLASATLLMAWYSSGAANCGLKFATVIAAVELLLSDVSSGMPLQYDTCGCAGRCDSEALSLPVSDERELFIIVYVGVYGGGSSNCCSCLPVSSVAVGDVIAGALSVGDN